MIARWSAWPALLCYAIASAIRLRPAPPLNSMWCQRIWGAGWIALVVHVVLSLGGVHHWSWSNAVTETARRTQLLLGWNWGGGVWFNLITVLIWGLDLLFVQADATVKPAWRRRWTIFCQTYLAFMIINATIVFGSLPARLLGLLIFGGLGVLVAKNRMRRSH